MTADELNQRAARALLADATYAINLTQFEDVRGSRDIVRERIARTRENYIDLAKRRHRIDMTSEDDLVFQAKLDRLQAILRFFREDL
jgi:hypothetical protein